MKRNSINWCPVCFDSLDCKEIKDIHGTIISYEYFCLGCDKTFILTEKTK